MSDDEYKRDGWRPSWKKSASTESRATARDGDYWAEPPEVFFPEPVQTQTADDVRKLAIRTLGAKVEKLRERSRRQRLTPLESRDLEEAESAIQTLRKMAPVGELLPARAGGLDQWVPDLEDITPWHDPE